MSTGVMAAAFATPAPRRHKSCWIGTPEVYFVKNIDNSRWVKVSDPKRSREMKMFAGTMCVLFALVMMYAWQHFSAVEYGYRIQALKARHDALLEANHELTMEKASLRETGRIVALAKKYGLDSPKPGQVVPLDSTVPDVGAPVVASAGFSVISVP